MKNTFLSALLIGLLCGCGSQKPEITGSKQVVTVSENISLPFTSVEVDENMHVELRKGTRNSYVLTTDDNIVPYIDFEVRGGTLVISNTHHIKKKKELEVILTVSKLNGLILRKESTLETRSQFLMDSLSLQTYDDSHFEMDIDIPYLTINMHDKSSGEIEGRSDQLFINMTDRSDLELEHVCDVLDIRLNEKAELELEGRGNEATITATDRTQLKGRDCEIDNAKVTLTGKAEVALEVSDNFTLNAKDKAMMHLYGSPKVDVESLADSAQIEKKD
ncbi:MAG: DUF2807 domain-containing protein [Leeuwenhoekiella sp.]